MKRILINATQSEELRVAIVDTDTQHLLDLLIERQHHKTKTGNIYLGKITAIEPSLDAVFVNFGSERHGFLPFKEIAPTYFNQDTSKSERTAIKDNVREGQAIMVQVEKEERGNKGAALTTFISLAGSYLVLMPNNPRAGGISRRVEGEDRDELRDVLSHLPIPEGMGLIVRTAGVGQASTELQWDLSSLLKQWEAIQRASTERNPPFLIHQESDVVIRAIRDHLRQDVTEILVDDTHVFERIKTHLEQIRPDFVHCLKAYTSPIPLFNRYQIEHQIEAAHEREVRLPSGGSIVIGHTEALVAIDVNSGQATKGKDIEQTALEINKEAARIIACQLRLRDIGGLVVIDFIDMPSIRHRREVENELRNALKLDKARTQIGAISSRFGLLEMSRQRLRHSLGEATRIVCPRCDGAGSIRSVESLALSILRMIEEDAIRPGTAQIQVQLPAEVATFIMNEKRDVIASIEKNQQIQIIVIPNPRLESPHYRIKRLTESESSGTGKVNPSYRLMEIQEPEAVYKKTPISGKEEMPMVKGLYTQTTRPAASTKKPVANIVKRLIASLFGGIEAEGEAAAKTTLAPAGSTAPPTPVRTSSERRQRGHERHHKSGHTTQKQQRPLRSQNTKNPAVAATTPTTTPTPTPTDKPETGSKDEHAAKTHPRSRRGVRGGGRRRQHGSGSTPAGLASPLHPETSEDQAPSQPSPQRQPRRPQPRPVSAPNLEESPPDHLPPFPSDLEDYYVKSAGFTPRKIAGPSEKKPEKQEHEVSKTASTTDTLPVHVVATPSTVAPIEKLVTDKTWTPHKIASASPVAPPSAQKSAVTPPQEKVNKEEGKE